MKRFVPNHKLDMSVTATLLDHNVDMKFFVTNHKLDMLVNATLLLNNVFCKNFVGDGFPDVP